MGNKKSRVIEVDNIQAHLNQCQQLGRRSTLWIDADCSVYGPVHLVKYQGMEFMLGEAHSDTTPPLGSLHYLVPPNLLVVPEFRLLEDSQPDTVDDLADILVGVAELCRDCDVGVGRKRLGYSNKWGIVGESNAEWAYQTVQDNPQIKGIYLSPQQLQSLKQGRPHPKHNSKKSDVFALGFMMMDIIFQEDLSQMFCYERLQIDLKPLVEKLKTVRERLGEYLYHILLRMMELEEEERVDFDQLLDMLAQTKTAALPQGPQTSRRGSVIGQQPSVSDYSSCRTPTNKSPRHRKSSVVIGANISPFKVGCFMDNVRTPERLGRTNKTPDRSNISNFNKETKVSPLKRDLRINTRFEKENKLGNIIGGGYQQSKSPLANRKPTVSPLSRR